MSEADAEFQRIVSERGSALRQLTYEQLKNLQDEPVEYVTVESRRGLIFTTIEHRPPSSVRVVVKGLLAKRLLFMVSNVAIDGFYKYADETTSPLTREDMWEFA